MTYLIIICKQSYYFSIIKYIKIAYEKKGFKTFILIIELFSNSASPQAQHLIVQEKLLIKNQQKQLILKHSQINVSQQVKIISSSLFHKFKLRQFLEHLSKSINQSSKVMPRPRGDYERPSRKQLKHILYCCAIQVTL